MLKIDIKNTDHLAVYRGLRFGHSCENLFWYDIVTGS